MAPRETSESEYIGFTIVCLLIIGICSLMPALLLYYEGYQETNWGYDAIQTTCQYVRYSWYSDSCPCKDCMGQKIKKCYDAWIYFTYETSYGTLEGDFRAFEKQFIEGDITVYLEENYPLQHNFTCYYQPDNPADVQFDIKSGRNVFLAFFIIFVIFGGCCAMIYIIGLLFLANCFSNWHISFFACSDSTQPDIELRDLGPIQGPE